MRWIAMIAALVAILMLVLPTAAQASGRHMVDDPEFNRFVVMLAPDDRDVR